MTLTVDQLLQMLTFVALVVIPLGAMIQHNRWRNADSRRSLYAQMQNLEQNLEKRIESVHVALDTFRTENAREMGQLQGRFSAVESRAFRSRAGDNATP